MEIDDWVADAKRRFKKESSHQAIDFISALVQGEDKTGPYDRVKSTETDGALLICWRHGNVIERFFTPDGLNILTRGIDNWPRGATRKYDELCDILDEKLRGNEEEAERLTRKFLDKGPIARGVASGAYDTEPERRKIRKKFRFKR